MPLPKMKPLQLIQYPEPFSRPNWIFEIKYDGFRSLAYIENMACSLVSRKRIDYKRFGDLAQAIAIEVDAKDAIVDGEIVVLNAEGKPQFYDLLYHRETPIFAAFHLLWLNGRT